MECPQCRSHVSDDATQCEACGSTWDALAEERPAPAGTWSEGTMPPGPLGEAPLSSPETEGKNLPEGSPPLPFRRPGGSRDADVTPLPGVALALVPPHPSHPDAAPRPETGTHRAMGEVVPLHPKNSDVAAEDVGTREEEPATPERPPGPPPLLASELLAEDLAPTEPYRRSSRAVYVLAGIGGMLVLSFGDWALATLAVSAFLIATGVVGVAPLPYRRRALASLAFGLGGLVASVTTVGGPGLLAGLATGSVTVLAGGLFLRNSHRAALSGRVLVLIGIVAGAAWLALSSRDQPLHTVALEWQSWAPAALKVSFFVVGLLSLLAFMDSSTHAGCALWGGLALTWLTVQVGSQVAIDFFDATGVRSPLWAALTTAQAPLAASTAIAITQALADLSRREGPGTSQPTTGQTPRPS